MTNILIQSKSNEISFEELEMDWKEFFKSLPLENEILDFGHDFLVYKTKDNIVKTAMIVDVLNNHNSKWFLHRNEVVCTYKNNENIWVINEDNVR